jgi:platelet-activating factor acetylhydrolase IB subunit alpha
MNFQITDLELQLEQVKKDAIGGGFTPREKKDQSEWIPRGPEKVELHGHRSPITRTIFHPQFSLLVTASEDSQIKVESKFSRDF